MAKRDVSLFFDDILDSIQKIEQYTAGITESEFELNFEKQDAIFRRLEIIGEAVKNIPAIVRMESPNVPWQKIAGLRDIIIHKLLWFDAKTNLEYYKERYSSNKNRNRNFSPKV